MPMATSSPSFTTPPAGSSKPAIPRPSSYAGMTTKADSSRRTKGARSFIISHDPSGPLETLTTPSGETLRFSYDEDGA